MSTKQERFLNHAAYAQTHRDSIQSSYRKALGAGMVDPVVLLLDPDDESARTLAENSGRGDEIAAVTAEGRRRGDVPVLLWALPRTLAARLLARVVDQVAATLAVPGGDGFFWLVVVAEGSASVALTSPRVKDPS